MIDVKRKTGYMGSVSDHYPVSMVDSMNFSKSEAKASDENSILLPKLIGKKVDKTAV